MVSKPKMNARYWASVVGRNVHRRRLERGLTRKVLVSELAKRGVTLSETQLWSLETGSSCNAGGSRTAVNVDRLVALATALGTTYVDLMTERT